jgi:hypothetical protein
VSGEKLRCQEKNFLLICPPQIAALSENFSAALPGHTEKLQKIL